MENPPRMQLPLFALNTVLYPGGALPLKVFEQRYVEMTKACLRDSSVFGVCLIREGKEVGDPAVPATVGCTARIEDWELPHPNLFHLLARGERRFQVHGSEVDPLGLIVAEVSLLPPANATEPPDALCRQVLAAAVEKLGTEHFGGRVALDDADWVSYRLAELLPLALDARQRLLETPEASERLALLHGLLVKAGVGGNS